MKTFKSLFVILIILFAGNGAFSQVNTIGGVIRVDGSDAIILGKLDLRLPGLPSGFDVVEGGSYITDSEEGLL